MRYERVICAVSRVRVLVGKPVSQFNRIYVVVGFEGLFMMHDGWGKSKAYRNVSGKKKDYFRCPETILVREPSSG